MPDDFTYMWNLINTINEQIEQKQIHGYREHFESCQMEGRLGEG